MAEEKYYTPAPEEFHIGFEYEERGLIKRDAWKPRILTSRMLECDHYESEVKRFGTEECRVKYLDGKDIEECGWHPYSKVDGWYVKKHKGYDTYLYLIPTKFHGLNGENSWMIETDVIKLDEQGNIEQVLPGKRTLYDGKIYNKSELRWIMDRLNIKPE